MKLILSGLSAQNVADLVSGFSGFTSILYLVVILFFGCYCGYGFLRLRRERELFPHRFLYPNYCPFDLCIDPEGYMDFIRPRIAVLSVIMLLSGLTQFVSYFIPSMRTVGLSLSIYVIPFVAFLCYTSALRKAAKRFW